MNRIDCPSWCVMAHRGDLSEEDWLHVSEPLPTAAAARAQLVMSIDPESGTVDGPFVMVGDAELTLEEAAELAGSLHTLVTSQPAG